MKQWQFNTLVMVVLVFVVILLLSSVMQLDPFYFIWNLLVYLVLVVVGLLCLPWFLGFAARYWLLPYLDDKADRQSDAGGFTHFIAGTCLAAINGFFWMKLLVPLFAKVSSLNSWPWALIRFPAGYETDPWGWFVYAVVAFGIAYFMTSASEA